MSGVSAELLDMPDIYARITRGSHQSPTFNADEKGRGEMKFSCGNCGRKGMALRARKTGKKRWHVCGTLFTEACVGSYECKKGGEDDNGESNAGAAQQLHDEKTSRTKRREAV